MSHELSHCPLCAETAQQEIYRARDRHYGIPGEYRIVRCAGCGLVFLNPALSDQELAALYPADYYAHQDRFHSAGWKEFLKKMLHCRIQTVDPRFPAPGRMLDLGCGSGWFMSMMRERGWETYGVEPNAAAAQIGRQTAGLDIFTGLLEEAAFPDSFFDYVRSNHSFEHVSCPRSTLEEIHRVLRPDGKLFIGVPNIASLNARLFREYWWYLGAPVHPFSYSVETLSRLLREHNFLLQAVRYNSDYSGILGSLQIWRNRGNGRKSTEGRIINNPLLKLSCHWTAKLVDLFHQGDAIEITAMKTAASI
ncbi:MAG TPA: class I SAM-dependent methyltransferase [Terriglobales bacterium]|nr:class I SAM-dependent methyltransferase [Terriglobales bacterium]